MSHKNKQPKPSLLDDVLHSIKNLKEPSGSLAKDIVAEIKRRRNNAYPRDLVVRVHQALKYANQNGIVSLLSNRYKLQTEGRTSRNKAFSRAAMTRNVPEPRKQQKHAKKPTYQRKIDLKRRRRYTTDTESTESSTTYCKSSSSDTSASVVKPTSYLIKDISTRHRKIRRERRKKGAKGAKRARRPRIPSPSVTPDENSPDEEPDDNNTNTNNEEPTLSLKKGVTPITGPSNNSACRNSTARSMGSRSRYFLRDSIARPICYTDQPPASNRRSFNSATKKASVPSAHFIFGKSPNKIKKEPTEQE